MKQKLHRKQPNILAIYKIRYKNMIYVRPSFQMHNFVLYWLQICTWEGSKQCSKVNFGKLCCHEINVYRKLNGVEIRRVNYLVNYFSSPSKFWYQNFVFVIQYINSQNIEKPLILKGLCIRWSHLSFYCQIYYKHSITFCIRS